MANRATPHSVGWIGYVLLLLLLVVLKSGNINNTQQLKSMASNGVNKGLEAERFRAPMVFLITECASCTMMALRRARGGDKGIAASSELKAVQQCAS